MKRRLSFGEADPHTAVTKTALRRLVTSGQIPSVRVGAKYLVDLGALDDFFGGKTTKTQTVQPGGDSSAGRRFGRSRRCCVKEKPPLVLQHERRRGRMILRSIIPALILPQAQQKRHRFFSLLQTGAENGVTLRELVAMTGMNERLVRLKIQQERKAGKLILSNNRDGYFLPECRRMCGALPVPCHAGQLRLQVLPRSGNGACGYDRAGVFEGWM